MAIGKSKITSEHREKAKEEKLCLFEIYVDARHAEQASADKTWLQGLKTLSLAGACTVADAHKMIDTIWGRNEKRKA